MTEGDLYFNVVQSLVKFIEDWRKANCPTAQYLDWDEHAQISELPKDAVLIGPAGCGMTDETSDIHEVVFSFGISTYQDKHLIQLRRLVSKLYGDLKIGTSLPVYDAESAGTVVGTMVIKSPRALTPVTKAEIRSMQFVEMSATMIFPIGNVVIAPALPARINNLVVGSVTTTTAVLAFTPSAGATSHQYRLNGGAAQTLSGTISGLTPSTTYTVEVRGVNGNGLGDWSNTASITTASNFVPPALLLENGGYLLLENGGKILLES